MMGETKRTKGTFEEDISRRIGVFLGLLSCHMIVAGGAVDSDSLCGMNLEEVLDICFRNGISFVIKNKHIVGYEPEIS